jgi:hypothetical protein
VGVFQPDHGGTGSAWQHHGIKGFKDFNSSCSQLNGLLAKATIEKWLSAAGLFGRKRYLAASSPENFHGSHTDLWKELIHDTGRAEGYNRSRRHKAILASIENWGEQKDGGIHQDISCSHYWYHIVPDFNEAK